MSDRLLDFTGKVILVRGGATGIGRATSLAFARHGSTLVIGDIDDRAAENVAPIEEARGTGLFVLTDVTSDLASFATGGVYVLDGGQTAH